MHWVTRSRVLLRRRLGNRGATVVCGVSVLGRYLLWPGRGSMVVRRLLLLLVAGVCVLLVHWHWGLGLVWAGITGVLWVLRIRCRMLRGLWRLHHGCRLWGWVLLWVLVLARAVGRHL